MLSSNVTERQLLEESVNALVELPEVQGHFSQVEQTTGPGLRHDAQVDIRVGGKDVTLLVDVKKTVYPRDVRQVLWLIREVARRETAERRSVVFFLVAHSISPGAKEMLRNESVGYYDSGGSLFLNTDNIYVYVDKPPPKSLSRSIRSIFSGRRAQVLHAILMRNREWFGVNEVAQWAEVSPTTASQVFTNLERFDWVVSRGQGPAKQRHLQEPGALLDAWVEHLKGARPLYMQRYFVPRARAEGLVEKLAEVCAQNETEYAITNEAAGQRYAPFLSTISKVHCRLLDGPAADRAVDALGARSVDAGSNLVVIKVNSSGDLLFRESINGVWLASTVQVYLDLLCSEGRAKELAMHLRREKIGF